jgi:hypothetical protein
MVQLESADFKALLKSRLLKIYKGEARGFSASFSVGFCFEDPALPVIFLKLSSRDCVLRAKQNSISLV